MRTSDRYLAVLSAALLAALVILAQATDTTTSAWPIIAALIGVSVLTMTVMLLAVGLCSTVWHRAERIADARYAARVRTYRPAGPERGYGYRVAEPAEAAEPDPFAKYELWHAPVAADVAADTGNGEPVAYDSQLAAWAVSTEADGRVAV